VRKATRERGQSSPVNAYHEVRSRDEFPNITGLLPSAYTGDENPML